MSTSIVYDLESDAWYAADDSGHMEMFSPLQLEAIRNYCDGLYSGFWTHDSTFHICMTKMPAAIKVTAFGECEPSISTKTYSFFDWSSHEL